MTNFVTSRYKQFENDKKKRLSIAATQTYMQWWDSTGSIKSSHKILLHQPTGQHYLLFILVPLVETEPAENITLVMEPPEKKKLIPPLLTYVFEYCCTFISILLSGFKSWVA